mmetsp:Transcript_21000/g.70035  ORF Transcript_21000/g.70035 Transcript_21000/m.70035 type:complete len:215 (+) Transcript_21000:736-1380(+)
MLSEVLSHRPLECGKAAPPIRTHSCARVRFRCRVLGEVRVSGLLHLRLREVAQRSARLPDQEVRRRFPHGRAARPPRHLQIKPVPVCNYRSLRLPRGHGGDREGARRQGRAARARDLERPGDQRGARDLPVQELLAATRRRVQEGHLRQGGGGQPAAGQGHLSPSGCLVPASFGLLLPPQSGVSRHPPWQQLQQVDEQRQQLAGSERGRGARAG